MEFFYQNFIHFNCIHFVIFMEGDKENMTLHHRLLARTSVFFFHHTLQLISFLDYKHFALPSLIKNFS